MRTWAALARLLARAAGREVGHGPRWRLVLLTLVVTLVMALSLTACTPPGFATTCDPSTLPAPPANHITLDSFSMASATDGWATGIAYSQRAGAVLFHLQNGVWSQLPQVYPGAQLTAISMDSPADGWTVSPYPVYSSTHPLALHYTSGAWRPVDVPALDAVLQPPPGYSDFHIEGIKLQMLAPQAGWMFVQTNIPLDLSHPDSRPRSLILRYEQHQWVSVPGPAIATTVELFDLSAVSADEAWAVGTDYGSNPTIYLYHYLHGRWIRSPQTFSGEANFITMLSATDGWAQNGSGLMHYDGARWSSFRPGPIMFLQRAYPYGAAFFEVRPGVAWMVSGQPGRFGLWQEQKMSWTQVAWPYSDMSPLGLGGGAKDEVWGIANITYQQGCPPGLGAYNQQGVFLHYVSGRWTRQELP